MGAASVGGAIGRALGAGGGGGAPPPPQTSITVMPGGGYPAGYYPPPVYAAGPGYPGAPPPPGYPGPPPPGYYPPPPAAAGYPAAAWQAPPAAAPSAPPPSAPYDPSAPEKAHGGMPQQQPVTAAAMGNPPPGFAWAAVEPLQWSLTAAFPGQFAGSSTPDGRQLFAMLRLVPTQ